MAEVLVDALPYIDLGYDDPGVREMAIAMVEEECRRYKPTKNYLEHLPTISGTPMTEIMSHEFERLQNRLPMEQMLNMKRYELPPPPPGRLGEIQAWQESVDNSLAQLEHQSIRAVNLELMLKYGCETWKVYLEVIVAMQAKAQKQLQEFKKEIQDVNWQRKSKQTKCGENLKHLEAKWVMLVSKNYEIEQAIANLEERIHQKKSEILPEVVENGTNGHLQPTEERQEEETEVCQQNQVEVEKEDEEMPDAPESESNENSNQDAPQESEESSNSNSST